MAIKTLTSKAVRAIIALPLVLAISGCAHANKNTNDPDEKINRKIYAFNNVADSLALRPATVVYAHILPSFIRTGIHNFFKNFNEAADVSNDLLQGKVKFALSDTSRFVINSTWGIGGTIDVARTFTLPPHDEDFGLTLAYWGAQKSNYSVMPVLGPSTYRDSVASPFDWFVLSVWPYMNKDSTYYTLLATWALDKRAQLLPADPLVNQAFDPYIFVRNAAMELRAQEVAENQLSYSEYRHKFMADQGHTLHSDDNSAASTATTANSSTNENHDGGIITVG